MCIFLEIKNLLRRKLKSTILSFQPTQINTYIIDRISGRKGQTFLSKIQRPAVVQDTSNPESLHLYLLSFGISLDGHTHYPLLIFVLHSELEFLKTLSNLLTIVHAQGKIQREPFQYTDFSVYFFHSFYGNDCMILRSTAAEKLFSFIFTNLYSSQKVKGK